MSETAITAELKSILEGVSGMGPVHDYERFSRSLAVMRDLLKDITGKINSCMIVFEGTDFLNVTMPVIDMAHNYSIELIMDLDDENDSTTPFKALLHAAFLAIIKSININGKARRIDNITKKSTTIDDEKAGKTLFHYGIIELRVSDREFY